MINQIKGEREKDKCRKDNLIPVIRGRAEGGDKEEDV